jgi:predicted dehydrogenase
MTQWRYLFSLEVFLEKGSLILNGLKTSSGVYGDEVLTIRRNAYKGDDSSDPSEETFTYEIDNSWASEITHFFDAINHNKEITYGSPSDALKLMNLIDKTYKK